MVGLSAAGVLRATMIPSLVMTQIVTATALLVLPSMAGDYGNGGIGQLRKKAVLCTISLTAIAAVYAGILAAFSQPIERLLFGGKFAAYVALIPILALVPVCNGFALGFALAVRARQKPHYDLIANAVSAPVGLVTALVFIHFWGLTGAALSLVSASACYGLVFCWAFLRDGRRISAPLASA
jgi:O-antigen/teichoic acid export membrane protein